MIKPAVKPLLTAMLACCGALLSMAPSQAAVIALNYDPNYGEPFQKLRWQVTADLYVPSACMETESFQPRTFIGSANPCGQSRVANVRLYFFDNSPSPNDPNVIVKRLDIGTYGAVSGVTSNEGETQALFSVTPTSSSALGYAFQTSWSNRLNGNSSVVAGDVFDFSLRLSLAFTDGVPGLGLAQLVHLNANNQTPQQRLDGFSSGGAVTTLAQRFAGLDEDFVPRRAGEVGQYLDNGGAGVSQVPEPGSIALVLAALLAAAVARRRRA